VSDRLVRVGWITLALGAIDLVRCIPEAISAGRLNAIYTGVLCMDLALAVLLGIAGWGLRQERPWAWVPAALIWGAVPANSGVVFSDLLPHYVRGFQDRLDWRQMLIFSPRMIFYILGMALMPYVLRVLLTSPSEGRPRNLTLWMFVAIGAACGAGIAFVVLKLPK
jgi:hypothetical protein